MAPSVSHIAGSHQRTRAKTLLHLGLDKPTLSSLKLAARGTNLFGGWSRQCIFLFGSLPFAFLLLYFSFANSQTKVKRELVEITSISTQTWSGNMSLQYQVDKPVSELDFAVDFDEPEEDEGLINDPVNKCTLKPSSWPLPPAQTTGYLFVRSNGGLNQMRASICDMVAVARIMNATMVVPELDRSSFWADQSQFADVFDLPHFLESLKDEIRIVGELPPQYSHLTPENVYTMDPVSWSDTGYYTKVLLPLLRKHEVIRLYQTDSRLANNPPDVSKPVQSLRCRVQYHALQFTKALRTLGHRIARRLHKRGPFIALHLRYEMDMLAFTGCTHGCTEAEESKLTRLRYRTARWREKKIDGVQRRRAGDCPLTPEEVGLMLRAMGYNKTTQLYIASGKIYGGKRRLARLLSIFPNTVRKEMLLKPEELAPFRNHSTQLAALDYMVSVAADVFLSTFHGNMARLVEGHRRYLGYRKTILPNRKKLVELFDAYENGNKTWRKLCSQVVKAHKNRLGGPQLRTVLPGRPKEEDNFFQNPQECMCSENTWNSTPSETQKDEDPSLLSAGQTVVLADTEVNKKTSEANGGETKSSQLKDIDLERLNQLSELKDNI